MKRTLTNKDGDRMIASQTPKAEAADVLEKLYTPEEVAEYLALSPLTIRAYLRTGKLEGVRIGGHWRVKESALEAFIAEQVAATPAEREAASRQAVGGWAKRADRPGRQPKGKA